MPSDLLTLEMTLIILLSACLTLFYANKNGIPLSTSEVTVGSIVGVGIALHQVNWMMLLVIVSAWLLMPCCSFLIAYGIGKWLKGREKKWISYMRPWHLRSLSLLLVTSGCYEAFSAGMNNIGNSIGPLVGAGLIAAPAGILIGSISLALGAVWMGRGVLETAAKKITNLSLFKGSAVSMTSGTIVIAASLWGIPVPLTQITIMAIYGISCPALNRGLFRHRTVVKMVKIWLFSPIASMLLSLTLVQVFVLHSFYYILLLFVLFFLALLLVFYSKHKNPTRS